MNSKTNKGFILPILIIIAVIVLGTIAYFFSPKSIQLTLPSPSPSQSPYVVSNPKQIKHTCLNDEIYKSNYFELEFVCQKGVEIIDAPEAMNISVAPYDWIWLTSTDIDKTIKDRADKLNTLNKIDSLKRVGSKSLFGISSKVFYEDKPYEGNPFFVYLTPKNDFYLYVQVMSSDQTTFDQILSTFKFIE